MMVEFFSALIELSVCKQRSWNQKVKVLVRQVESKRYICQGSLSSSHLSLNICLFTQSREYHSQHFSQSQGQLYNGLSSYIYELLPCGSYEGRKEAKTTNSGTKLNHNKKRHIKMELKSWQKRGSNNRRKKVKDWRGWRIMKKLVPD